MTTPVNVTPYLSNTSENELKSPNTKSPAKSSSLKRKMPKGSHNIENMEPNQTKSTSFTESATNANIAENKPLPNTPGNLKNEQPIIEATATTREHNLPPSKPAESPFTAFCKGLHLSPGPGPMPSVSPGLFGKNNLFFGGGEVNNFISPSPLNFHMGPECGNSSPLFPRKHVSKSDFNNRFIMFKSNRDDIGIEPEEGNEKYDEPAMSYEEIPPLSPKFSFPQKKSIYTNTNLVATQSRTNNIYSESPTKAVRGESEGKEETQINEQSEKMNEEQEETKQGTTNTSSGKNDNQQKSSQANEGLLMQRTISFGAANQNGNSDFNTANSSARSSVVKAKATDEEDADYEESESGARASSTKKKVCCNCKKSRCLKLYCDCFARGKGCTKDCNCQSCLNNEDNAEERKNAMLSTLERNPIAFKPKVNLSDTVEKVETKDKARHIKGCNCKKSGCLKKYCECFQAGAKCTDVCKCENCKNTDPAAAKKSHAYGNCSGGSESREKPSLRLDSPLSEVHEHSHSNKTNTRSLRALGHDDADENSLDDDSDHDEDVKRYSNPRKQLFPSSKTPMNIHNQSDRFSGDHLDEGTKYKNKKGKRKGSAVSIPPKTPTSYSEAQKKGYDYTPSPEKQSLSGGRTRRNVRPFSHINPDEYELGK